VSTDTLRHYERLGILPPPRRTPSGYRLYGPEALDRVRAARAALAVGFTLAEVAEVFADRDRGRVPCRRVRELAGEKLALVEARLVELSAVRDRLRALIGRWDERLSALPPGVPARLLESIEPGEARRATSHTPVRKRRTDP
jgi:DNA-binding transcriptional MerR regulator